MKNKEFPEEGEVLLGSVDRIIRTNVFIKLDEYGKEGVMSFSEVSPGRIRNIRKYVVPGQKIVCKVLRIDKATGHIDLSLRRVTAREKKEVLEIYKKKKDFLVMLGVIIKEKKHIDDLVSRIEKTKSLIQFLEELTAKLSKIKESISMLKEVGFSEDEASKLLNLIKEKAKERRVSVKAKIKLSSEAEDGIERIKKILSEIGEKAKISYVGAPNYLIAVENTDYKEANKKLKEFIDEIEVRAKKLGCYFEFPKKK